MLTDVISLDVLKSLGVKLGILSNLTILNNSSLARLHVVNSNLLKSASSNNAGDFE